MRIGILTANKGAEEVHENERLVYEIEQSGHEPAIIYYPETAVAVTEEGRFLWAFDENANKVAVEVDAVIPRINETDPTSVGLGMNALEMLISKGVYSTASPQAIELAKNKVRSKILLDAAGIPTPYGASPTGVKDRHTDDKRRSKIFQQILAIVEEDPKRQVIIKTMTGTQGKGVKLGVGRNSARSIMESDDEHGIPMIAEEFVDTPERSDAHEDLRLIVIGGQVVASMKRTAQSENDFRANLSLGAVGERYEPTQREAELAIRAVAVLGLDAGGVDELKSHRGPLVTEVNASPGFGIEELAAADGQEDGKFNIARLLVQLAIQKASESAIMPPYTDEFPSSPAVR